MRAHSPARGRGARQASPPPDDHFVPADHKLQRPGLHKLQWAPYLNLNDLDRPAQAS